MICVAFRSLVFGCSREELHLSLSLVSVIRTLLRSSSYQFYSPTIPRCAVLAIVSDQPLLSFVYDSAFPLQFVYRRSYGVFAHVVVFSARSSVLSFLVVYDLID